jgi:hypothetical protein
VIDLVFLAAARAQVVFANVSITAALLRAFAHLSRELPPPVEYVGVEWFDFSRADLTGSVRGTRDDRQR